MHRTLGSFARHAVWLWTLVLPSGFAWAQATPNDPAGYGPAYPASAPQTQTAAPQQYASPDNGSAQQPQYGPQYAPQGQQYPQAQQYPQNPGGNGYSPPAGQAIPGQAYSGQPGQVQPSQPGQPGQAGQPAQGQPGLAHQNPHEQPPTPNAPFVLSPPERQALENLLTDWEKRNKEIHVLDSKFYRWKYDLVFGGNQAPPCDEGEMKFASPDKAWMKVDAKDATQSEQWLCDGKSVFQWDYRNKKVTEYLLPPELQGKSIGDGPLPFVFGIEAQKLKQRYFMRIITPPNVPNQVWLEAYPRFQHDAANFYKVEVILQIVGPTHTLFPFAIQIYAPNQKDRTVYQLQNPLINPRGPLIHIFDGDWTKPSIGFGWEKRTDLPPGVSPPSPPPRTGMTGGFGLR